MTPLRHLLLRAFRGAPAAATVRVLERLADAPRGRYAVLTYHRVDDPSARPWLYPPLLSATPSGFEHQLREVAAHYQPIGLPDLLAAHRGEASLPRRAVLVTFDDAYTDFGTTAWPILRQLGIPATLFVPTAYPDAGQPYWWDRLWDAVRRADGQTIDTPAGRLQAASAGDRLRAARVLVDFYKRMPHETAMRGVAELVDRFGAPGMPMESDVLGWDDLRRLSEGGVHVAAHSRTHPLLTQVDPDRLAAEVLGSRRDLERELPGRAYGTVFAYPAGQHNQRTRSALADLGVELAFTTDRGVNQVRSDDAYALRRVNVGLRSRGQLIRAQVAFYTLRYSAGGQ